VGDCFSLDRIRWSFDGAERSAMRENAGERERKGSDKGEADVDTMTAKVIKTGSARAGSADWEPGP